VLLLKSTVNCFYFLLSFHCVVLIILCGFMLSTIMGLRHIICIIFFIIVFRSILLFFIFSNIRLVFKSLCFNFSAGKRWIGLRLLLLLLYFNGRLWLTFYNFFFHNLLFNIFFNFLLHIFFFSIRLLNFFLNGLLFLNVCVLFNWQSFIYFFFYILTDLDHYLFLLMCFNVNLFWINIVNFLHFLLLWPLLFIFLC